MTPVLEILFHGIASMFEPRRDKSFNSTFGDITEIANSWNHGFLINKSDRLTKLQSFQNLLICGPTGSGKTTRVLLKNLLELKNCSIVVNDPSKELYTLASGYLSQYYDIKTLNFSDSSVSSGYNILSRIKRSNDIQKISNILVSSTLEKGNSSGDQFWVLQTKVLLNILLRLIQFQPEVYRNMANVKFLLDVFAVKPKFIDSLIAQTNDKPLILEYKSLIASPEKTLQNITASAKAALQIFSDEEFAKVTSVDTISFEALRERPTIIFLHNSIADQRHASILISVFFQQFYEYILSRIPNKKELPIYIILEEASSLYIPVLPISLANTRKHSCATMVAIQNVKQLENFYGKEAENIASNCVTKCYLPGITSLENLREIESLGGKMTYIDENGKEKSKNLMTVDEIRRMDENEILILCGNKPFILSKTSPYYLSFKYSRRASYQPAPFKGEIPQTPIRLIGEKPTEESNTQTNN